MSIWGSTGWNALAWNGSLGTGFPTYRSYFAKIARQGGEVDPLRGYASPHAASAPPWTSSIALQGGGIDPERGVATPY